MNESLLTHKLSPEPDTRQVTVRPRTYVVQRGGDEPMMIFVFDFATIKQLTHIDPHYIIYIVIGLLRPKCQQSLLLYLFLVLRHANEVFPENSNILTDCNSFLFDLFPHESSNGFSVYLRRASLYTAVASCESSDYNHSALLCPFGRFLGFTATD